MLFLCSLLVTGSEFFSERLCVWEMIKIAEWRDERDCGPLLVG